MGQQSPVFDLTFLDSNDNALFGSTSSGGVITQSDFQTPDTAKSHPRDYLQVPENFTATEIDPIQGSSTIGAVSVGVVDFRTTATDQSTGEVTASIKDTVGSKAVLRRWDDSASQWRVVFRGVAHTYSVDEDDLVVYNFHLRDSREFERGGKLFSSNFVLWGKDGEQGSPINYGELPSGSILNTSVRSTHLLPKVEGDPSESLGSVSDFTFFSDTSDPTDGIFFGYVLATADDGDLSLPDLGTPTQREDGLWYYESIRVRWRAKGSNNSWTVLRDMPASDNSNVVGKDFAFGRGPDGDPLPATGLYMSSTNKDNLPTDGQAIEFQVLAEEITEEHPFFWDGGTLGDLLNEIVNGDHTSGTPQEQYDSTALSNFQTNSPKARFILREPVEDRRTWVEENIYKAALVAPSYNNNRDIAPTSWRLPEDTTSLTKLDIETIQPVGSFEHGTGQAVSEVRYTYIREHLQTEEDAKERLDIQDDTESTTLDRWDRLFEEEITSATSATSPATGARPVEYAPITIRSIGTVNGYPVGGDTQDEIGNRLATDAAETLIPRFKDGAATYTVECIATTTVLGINTGDFVRVDASWLPEYSDGVRGMDRIFQVIAISDIDPSIREFKLLDTTVPARDTSQSSTSSCISGGTAHPGPDGVEVRQFGDSATIENTCGSDVTLPKVLLVAGGGGGDSTGGGAGEAKVATDVKIAANTTIQVDVGSGGSASGGQGGDTILWVDSNGDALDPATDTPQSSLKASGGNLDGTQGQCGDGVHFRGSSCTITGACEVSGSPGGGSNGSDGGDASCDSDTCTSTGGCGAAGVEFTDFGVVTGGGGGGNGSIDMSEIKCGQQNSFDGGYPGGGGSGQRSAAGKDGTLLILFSSSVQAELNDPTITSTSETTENQVKVCITEDDWPATSVSGYRVRVEYAYGATGDSEPSADSGDWRVAGYLEEPGCVYTEPVPTGARVWTRAIAEADEHLPTSPSTTQEDDTTADAALIQSTVTVDQSTGEPSLEWYENDDTESVRIRAEVLSTGDTPTDPLPQISDVVASDRSYALSSLTLGEGQFVVVDMEAWDAVDHDYDGVVTGDSPAGYWRLGEGSGTTANDETSNNHDGTYEGDPTLGTSGLLADDSNTAITLDGTGDRVRIPDDAAWDSDTLTLEAWVTTSANVLQQIVTRDGDTDRVWQFRMDADGKVRVVFFISGSPIEVVGTSAINDSGTHHVVATYDGADIRVYVDGTEENSSAQTGALDDGANDILIGARERNGPTEHWTGVMDEVAIFGDALTSAEVQQHYNAGAGVTTDATTVAGTEGKTAREQARRFTPTAASPDDVDNVLDRLMFDTDGEVVVDNDFNPVTDPT